MHSTCRPLPIVPADLLRRFHVNETSDTRFGSCARLLQSIWRHNRNFDPGRHRPLKRKSRKLGSRLALPAARTGVNFLTPEIAKIVRMEAAYREIGALIEERRLWENLLSSQALTFNLFAKLKTDQKVASRFWSKLVPGVLKQVERIVFEHSPGRGDPAFLGDYTAFDVFVQGTAANGAPAFLAIEVKYAETLRQQQRRSASLRYRELTLEYALHCDPADPGLFSEPMAQLTAEHLLAAVIRDRLGRDAIGAFVTIAPAANREAWIAIELYMRSVNSATTPVPFKPITLEAAIELIGATVDADLANRLVERYTDFGPVHALIDDWAPFAEREA